VPSLSHQLPVDAVEVTVGVVAVLVIDVAMIVVVDFVAWVGAIVVVAVDVDVPQEAKIIDIIMRLMSTIQMAPFFI
jgi:hypothetical protein